MSLLIKMIYFVSSIEGWYESYLYNLIFYSNFANLLTIPQNLYIFMAFYVFTLLSVLFPLIFVFLSGILKNYYKINVERNFFWKLSKTLLFYYNWILVIPFLSIVISPLDCDWFSFTRPCFGIFSIFMFFGIVFSIFILFQSILLSYSCQNYKFSTNRLEIQWSFLRFLILCLRNFSVILSFLLKNNNIFLYFALHLFAILSFIELLYVKPIRNEMIHKTYLKYLCMFEGIVILMTLKNYTDDETFFYLFFLLSILSLKLGDKISKLLINNGFLQFSNDFPNNLSKCKEIEFTQEKVAEFFRLVGFFKNHFLREKCENSLCDDLKSNFNFLIDAKQLDLFIINKLEISINEKNISDYERNEIILKYFDFIRFHVSNPQQILFKFQKFRTKVENPSFFLESYIKRIQLLLKEKIICDEKQHLIEKNKDYFEMKVFLQISKLKSKIVSKICCLIEEKKTFWRNYVTGFKTMDVFIEKIQKLAQKLEDFRYFIERKHRKIHFQCVTLKALSLFYSIFLNDLCLAEKYEDQYQKIYINELILNRNFKDKLSFIDKNIIVCEASFLSNDGIIKNSSKTSEFAKFFGFPLQEIELIKTIDELMPPYFKTFHPEIIKNYLNRSKREKNKYPFKVFAQHKKGYIFPINIYLSLKLNTDDFIIISAILRDPNNDEQSMVFNTEGQILGISEKMQFILMSKIQNFTLSTFLTLNIFDCCNDLKNISLTQLSNNELFLGKHSSFIIQTLEKNKGSSGNSSSSKFKRGISISPRNKQKTHVPLIRNYRFLITFDLNIFNYRINENKKVSIFNLLIKNIVSEDALSNFFAFNEIEKNPMNHVKKANNNEIKNLFKKSTKEEIKLKKTEFDNEENFTPSMNCEDELREIPKMFTMKGKTSLNFQEQNAKITNFENLNNTPTPLKIDVNFNEEQNKTPLKIDLTFEEKEETNNSKGSQEKKLSELRILINL